MRAGDRDAVVLDIEGTVSPLAAVYDVLFPYARSRIEAWVREGRVPAVVAEVRAMLGGEPGGPGTWCGRCWPGTTRTPSTAR